MYSETPDQSDLTFGTVVVLDTLSQPTDLGSKGQEFRVWGLGYG